MQHNDALIIAFIILWFVTQLHLFKVNIYLGFVYLFIFIYSIFTQIGYVFFPELSMLISAYFGADIFPQYWLFVSLSMLTFYACCIFGHNRIYPIQLCVRQSPCRYTKIFIAIIIAVIIFELTYLTANYSIITYQNASDQAFISSSNILYAMFGFLFKQLVPILALLHVLFRLNLPSNQAPPRWNIVLLYITTLLTFGIITFKIGSRTDPLALILSILTFELTRSRKPLYTILKFIPVGAIGLIAMLIIESTRSQESATISGFQSLIFKDYYAPSHILIAAIHFNFTHPWEVIRSNLANSLFLMNQPYLQQPVTELFNPGVTTRSASYAFYIFSEGFIFCGWWGGFIYNGVLTFLGFQVWRSLCITRNSYFNLFGVAIIGSQLVNMARSQTSFFIKYPLTLFLPALVLFYLATGMYPQFKGRGKNPR